MNVPEIQKVKSHLEELKQTSIISSWELPYENLLTRLSAAIFYVSGDLQKIETELGSYPNFRVKPNLEKTLSQLQYEVLFSKEEL